MITYDTMVEAINGLQKRGFTHDFNFENDCLQCKSIDGVYQLDEFKILEHHRFEGASDPGDLSEIYAIQTVSGIKGILTDGYGISSSLSFELIKKLSSSK